MCSACDTMVFAYFAFPEKSAGGSEFDPLIVMMLVKPFRESRALSESECVVDRLAGKQGKENDCEDGVFDGFGHTRL